MRKKRNRSKLREQFAVGGSHRSRRSFLVAILGLLAATPACGADNEREAAELHIVSDRSIVFTAPAQSIQAIAAVVDADGVPLDVEVTWESSDPDQVAVDYRGMVTALEPLGSSIISASYGELRAFATAVVVDLSSDGVLVDSDHVVEVLPRRITLVRNPATEEIARGDVVLNGGTPGFLGRVLRVDVSGAQVLLHVETAALTDAIAALDLAFRADAIVPPDESTDAGSDGGVGESALSPADNARIGELTVPLECKHGDAVVDVEVAAFNHAPRTGLATEVQLRIRDQTVELFQLALAGDFGVETRFEQVKMPGGARGQVECKAVLAAIPFAAIPIVGPIVVTAAAAPEIGVEIELDHRSTELILNGAVAKKAIRLRVGVGYDLTEGFRLLDELDVLDDDLDLSPALQRPDDTFTARIEPFFGLEWGIAQSVGAFPVDEVGLVRTKVFGGYELEVTMPLSPEEIGYRGPRWNVYVGAAADIEPLLDDLALFDRLLGFLGLQGAQSLLGVSPEVFILRLPLSESPAPTITVSPSLVTNGETVTLTYRGLGDAVGARIDGLLSDGASTRTLGRLQTTGSGTEELVWTPSRDEIGTYTADVRLFDDLFGAVNLPYASTVRPVIQVLCAGQGCLTTPDSDPGSGR